MKTVFVMVSAALLIVAAPVAAKTGKIYTWTDDKGVTHITETPPPADGQLDDVMEYTPPTPDQKQAVEEKLESMRSESEKRRLTDAAERAKREAQQARQRAVEAQAKVADEQAALEEYKMKFGNTTERRRRFRFEIQKREMQVLDAREAALRAADEAREAERRAAEAQQRVDTYTPPQSPEGGGIPQTP
jgi:hypothetical protein